MIKEIDLYRSRVIELEKRIEELEAGACRFNCRSVRDAYIAGFEDGVNDGAQAGAFLDMDYKKKVIRKAYRKWRRGET